MSKPSSHVGSLWKGKAKANESDFDDLNPVITYRHLQSQSFGPTHPLRVIALCDSDAFYAACEQVRLDLDPTKPLVVQQWEALIAVNYPARKYGISRMDKIKDAKQRCPELIAVHVATYKEGEKEPGYWPNPDTRTHKVSLDHYRRESMKILAMFKEGLPGGEIEKASIDEAFIDFSRPVRDIILERYPHVARVPPGADPDTPLPPPPPIDWSSRGTLVPVHPPPEGDDGETVKEGEDRGVGEAEGGQTMKDGEDRETVEATTWHDVALSIAAELMGRIREDIRDRLGYTTSAGIARNKFLAKLAASYRKPMSQTILRNSAIPNYLRPMKFQKIRNLGGKLGAALAEQFDASSVGDLLAVSLDDIQRKFGEDSLWVYEVIRGIDRSEVKEKSVVNKSMLASKNLAQPVTRASDGPHWIRVLAAELALRLREARDERPGLWPKSLVLHVRQGYGQFRSKQAGFPFVRDISVDVIAAAGDKLWKELVGTGDTPEIKITNVQLAFTGVETMEDGQRNIEGFFSRPNDERAPEIAKRKHEHEHDDDDGGSASAHPPKRRTSQGTAHADAMPFVGRPSFSCPRCGKSISLPEGLGSLEGDEGRAVLEDALAALRLEHEDFHFAEDLSRKKIRPMSGTQAGGSKAKEAKTKEAKTKAKVSKGGGIASYFMSR